MNLNININIAITAQHNPNITFTSQFPHHPGSPHHYTSWPMTTRTGLCWQKAEQQLQQRNHNWLLLLLQEAEILEAGLVWFGLSIREFHHWYEDRRFRNQVRDWNYVYIDIDYGWNLNKDMYWWGQQYVRESWRTTGLSLVSHITMNALSQFND